MALTNSQTFCGKDSTFFYGTALGTGRAKQEFTMFSGVKDSINLNQFDLGTIISTGSTCTWSNTGEGTLDEKNLEVQNYKIQLEFCTDSFEASFLSLQMRPGTAQSQLPASFEEYLLIKVAEKLANEIENDLFNHATYGIITQALADANVVDVAAIASTAMTSSNVVTELNRVINALDADVRADVANTVIFVSPTVANLLRQYYGTIALVGFGPEYAQAGILNYLGYKVVESTVLSGVRMFAANKNNLFYATDLGTDEQKVTLIDMYPTTGTRSVRVAANWKAGWTYGVGAEVVLYS